MSWVVSAATHGSLVLEARFLHLLEATGKPSHSACLLLETPPGACACVFLEATGTRVKHPSSHRACLLARGPTGHPATRLALSTCLSGRSHVIHLISSAQPLMGSAPRQRAGRERSRRAPSRSSSGLWLRAMLVRHGASDRFVVPSHSCGTGVHRTHMPTCGTRSPSDPGEFDQREWNARGLRVWSCY